MTRAEALEVLGLVEGASDDEVRDAYSSLIKKVHPDRGGTAYLATRVNLARDLLLAKH
jgi:curved DNA-binding protein CbpA